MLERTTTSATVRAIIACIGACVPISLASAQMQILSRTGNFHLVAGPTDHSTSFNLASGDVFPTDNLQDQGTPCHPGSNSHGEMTTVLRPQSITFNASGTVFVDAAACDTISQSMSHTDESITFTVATPIHVSLSGFLYGCVSPMSGSDPSLTVTLSGAAMTPLTVAVAGSDEQNFSYCVELRPGQYNLSVSGQASVHSLAGDAWSSGFVMSASLNIVEPAVLVPSPSLARPCPGSTIKLNLTSPVPNGSTFQWRKDGAILTDAGNVSGVGTTQLRIDNASASDAGSYDCIVSAECGPTSSAAATVSFCAADFDCSGNIAPLDVLEYINAWFASDPRADMDGVNGDQIADIFVFLNAWFAGCP